jgi:hypothetical protein
MLQSTHCRPTTPSPSHSSGRWRWHSHARVWPAQTQMGPEGPRSGPEGRCHQPPRRQAAPSSPASHPVLRHPARRAAAGTILTREHRRRPWRAPRLPSKHAGRGKAAAAGTAGLCPAACVDDGGGGRGGESWGLGFGSPRLCPRGTEQDRTNVSRSQGHIFPVPLAPELDGGSFKSKRMATQ